MCIHTFFRDLWSHSPSSSSSGYQVLNAAESHCLTLLYAQFSWDSRMMKVVLWWSGLRGNKLNEAGKEWSENRLEPNFGCLEMARTLDFPLVQKGAINHIQWWYFNCYPIYEFPFCQWLLRKWLVQAPTLSLITSDITRPHSSIGWESSAV